MIKVKYNIGSKPHEEEFKNYEELGKWIVKNYNLKIIDVNEGAEKDDKK